MTPLASSRNFQVVKLLQLLTPLVLMTAILSLAPSALAQDDELPPWLRAQEAADSGLEPEEEEPADPMRLLLRLGGGTSVRFAANDYYQQDLFAPAFVDLSLGVVLPGRGNVRHVLGVNLSSNITGDGSASQGVDAFGQIVVGPSYGIRLGYDEPVPDWTLLMSISAPFTVTHAINPGLEVGAALTYMLFAGTGLYAEASVSTYLGGPGRSSDLSVHAFGSAEAGIVIDFEVLP